MMNVTSSIDAMSMMISLTMGLQAVLHACLFLSFMMRLVLTGSDDIGGYAGRIVWLCSCDRSWLFLKSSADWMIVDLAIDHKLSLQMCLFLRCSCSCSHSLAWTVRLER